jgi:hypothetical protein
MKFIRAIKNSTADIEWICIKTPLIFFWFVLFKHCLSKGYQVPLPQGVCKLINCSLFIEGLGLTMITGFAIFLSVAYLLEIKMKWVTLCIFCSSVIVFTSEESSGILNRNGMFSYLFLAQAFAYWAKSSNLLNLKFSRIQYSIQAVAVGYFLSGCSKLLDSGLNWPKDGSRITLQVLKSFHYAYYTNLDANELVKAEEIIRFLSDSQYILVVVLAVSLVLELFALSTAINKRFARIYGLALLCMHIGINHFMDILIESFAIPMVIVLINPLFLAVLLFNKVFNKIGIMFKLKSA